MKSVVWACAAVIAASFTSVPADAATFYVFGNSPTGAQTLTVNGSTKWNATQTGWFDSTGRHRPALTNYYTGTQSDWMGTIEYRSFFSFQPTGVVTSASLTLGNALSGGYWNDTGKALELTLYDVSSSIVGMRNYSGSKDIFDDLGTGTVYGKIRIDGAASSYTIELNQAAVDAINLAAKGFGPFTVGARLTALPSAPSGVPEPAAWALMLGGFGLMGGALRARRRRTTVRYV